MERSWKIKYYVNRERRKEGRGRGRGRRRRRRGRGREIGGRAGEGGTEMLARHANENAPFGSGSSCPRCDYVDHRKHTQLSPSRIQLTKIINKTQCCFKLLSF